MSAPVRAATAAELDHDGRAALIRLYNKNPKAYEVATRAIAVLVFPTVVKAGFIFGAQGGDGALYRNGQVAGYYNTSAVSYGLQAGMQKYGYALFFMNPGALAYLHKSKGWEIGVGPSIVVVDAGTAKTLTTTTMKKDIYAFIFDQKGVDGRSRPAGLQDHALHSEPLDRAMRCGLTWPGGLGQREVQGGEKILVLDRLGEANHGAGLHGAAPHQSLILLGQDDDRGWRGPACSARQGDRNRSIAPTGYRAG